LEVFAPGTAPDNAGNDLGVFGKAYLSHLNLIFTNPQGDYLKPDSVTAAACLIARKVGLKGMRLHSLRHSQLSSRGVPPRTVSKNGWAYDLAHRRGVVIALVHGRSSGGCGPVGYGDARCDERTIEAVMISSPTTGVVRTQGKW
jgi:hypothetical protein